MGFLKSYRTPFLLKGLRNGSRKREPGPPGVNSQPHTTVCVKFGTKLIGIKIKEKQNCDIESSRDTGTVF